MRSHLHLGGTNTQKATSGTRETRRLKTSTAVEVLGACGGGSFLESLSFGKGQTSCLPKKVVFLNKLNKLPQKYLLQFKENIKP